MKPLSCLELRTAIVMFLTIAAYGALEAQKVQKPVKNTPKTHQTVQKGSSVKTPKAGKTGKIADRSKKVDVKKMKGGKAGSTKKSKKNTSDSKAKRAAKTAEKKRTPPPVIQQVLKTAPVSWFFLTANLAYEKVLSRHTSIQIAGSYTHQTGEVFQGLSATFSGYGVTPQLRYYWMPISKLIAPARKGKSPETPDMAAPVSFYTALWGRQNEYRGFVRFPDHPDQKGEIFYRKAYSVGLNFGSQFWLRFRKNPILLCDIALGGAWGNAKTELKFAQEGKRVKTERKGFVPHAEFRLGVPLYFKRK